MKNHPYILTTLIALVLAVVVWLCVPKEYTAMTKVSDEYKEVDLAIGMNMIGAQVREALGGANTGMNDIEVYSKNLKSEDFARTISHMQVPDKGMTYGEYLGEVDTIAEIRDRISYRLTNQNAAMIVSFTDRDALVASQMLDSVTIQLQRIVTNYRHNMAEVSMRNATKNMQDAKQRYEKCRQAYTAFSDSHANGKTKSVLMEEKRLEKETTVAYDHLRSATNEYVRQKSLMQRSYMSFAVVQANTVPLGSNAHLIGYMLVFVLAAWLMTKGFFLYRKRRIEKRVADYGDISAPWIITVAIWGLVVLCLQFCDPSLLKQPGEQFYISLGIWLPLFCLSSFMTYQLMDRSERKVSNISYTLDQTELSHQLFNLLLIISIVITPLYVKKIMDVVLMFGTEDFMSSVRTYSVYGDAQLGLLNYSSVINKALMLVAVWGYPRIKLWHVSWTCIANLLNSLAIMEKGGILLVFFCIVFVLFMRKVISLRTIVLLSLLVIVLFYGFNLMRAEDDSDYQKNETLLGFFAMYVLSPPVAYCEVVREISPQFGGHTFSLIYVFLNRFGFGPYVIFERLQDFVYVPMPTNVYTIFQPFFLDFGQVGVGVFAVVYGVVSGITYRLMRNGNDFGKCMYLYTAYILVLQFFQENVFTVNLHVIQLTFFVYLCTQKRFSLSFSSSLSLKRALSL